MKNNISPNSADLSIIPFKDIVGKSATKQNSYGALLLRRGSGQLLIDASLYSLAAPEIYFTSPGQYLRLEHSHSLIGEALVFSPDFLIRQNIQEQFLSNINLFRPFGENPPLPLEPAGLKKLRTYFSAIVEELDRSGPYRDEALAAWLRLILIECSQNCQLDLTQFSDRPGVCILRDFKSLIDRRFRETHQVQDYASKLHVSTRHMSSTVKKLTGRSAKELIQDRITLEAKRLLLHSILPVAEVAYELGFRDPMHFSAFFSKQAGQSPREFRSTRA